MATNRSIGRGIAEVSPYIYANDNPITITDFFGTDTTYFAKLQPVEVMAKWEWEPSNWWQVFQMFGNVLMMYPNYNIYNINKDLSVQRKQIMPIPQISMGIVPGSIAGPESEGIEITGQALQHILETHLQSGLKSIGKSLFTVGKEEILQLIKNAETIASTKQIGGNLERVVDAGRKIGIDRASGLPTSTYTVITTQSGKLITAFPGKP